MHTKSLFTLCLVVGCGGFEPSEEEPAFEERGGGISGTTAGLQAIADAAGGDSASIEVDGREGRMSLTYHRADAIDDGGIGQLEEYTVELSEFSLDGKTFVSGTLSYSRVSQVGSEGFLEKEDLEAAVAISGEETASLTGELHRFDSVGDDGIADDETGKLEIEGRPFDYLEALFIEVSETIDTAGDSRASAGS